MVENKNSLNSINLFDHSILETMPIESVQKEAIISDKEVLEHKKLNIKVRMLYYYLYQEVSGGMFDGKEVVINAKGLVSGGLRNKEDGLVFFGFVDKDKNEVVNDFLLKEQVKESKPVLFRTKTYNPDDNLSSSSLFLVYYRRDNQKYYLKPLDKNESSYCFVNLSFPYVSFLLLNNLLFI